MTETKMYEQTYENDFPFLDTKLTQVPKNMITDLMMECELDDVDVNEPPILWMHPDVQHDMYERDKMNLEDILQEISTMDKTEQAIYIGHTLSNLGDCSRKQFKTWLKNMPQGNEEAIQQQSRLPRVDLISKTQLFWTLNYMEYLNRCKMQNHNDVSKTLDLKPYAQLLQSIPISEQLTYRINLEDQLQRGLQALIEIQALEAITMHKKQNCQAQLLLLEQEDCVNSRLLIQTLLYAVGVKEFQTPLQEMIASNILKTIYNNNKPIQNICGGPNFNPLQAYVEDQNLDKKLIFQEAQLNAIKQLHLCHFHYKKDFETSDFQCITANGTIHNHHSQLNDRK